MMTEQNCTDDQYSEMKKRADLLCVALRDATSEYEQICKEVDAVASIRGENKTPPVHNLNRDHGWCLDDKHWERIRECCTALAGIPDPAAFVAAAKENQEQIDHMDEMGWENGNA